MWYAVGNQAGDADSVVSALAAAHLLNHTQSKSGDEIQPKCRALVSFPRRDLRLRGDVVKLFRLAGWEFEPHDPMMPKGLLFLDEVHDVKDVVLTDANVVGVHLKQFGDVKVKAIIDHHRDEGSFLDAKPRLVDEAAGSTCSMLANEILSVSHVSCPQSLCVLMYGVILLDTRNFSGGRHSDLDVKALELLSKQIPADLIKNQDRIYKDLMDARNDISHLTVPELFRLDYKEVNEHGERLGFSTLFDTVSRLVDPSRKVEEAMIELMDEKMLSALFAITSVEADSERRGFLLCSREAKLADGIVEGLKAKPKEIFSTDFMSLPLITSQKINERGFGLEPIHHPMGGSSPKVSRAGHSFSAWTVHGTITRKTLLPAVVELIARVKRL